jgi:hypothetical protein
MQCGTSKYRGVIAGLKGMADSKTMNVKELMHTPYHPVRPRPENRKRTFQALPNGLGFPKAG